MDLFGLGVIWIYMDYREGLYIIIWDYLGMIWILERDYI